jgi:hypothetical protein
MSKKEGSVEFQESEPAVSNQHLVAFTCSQIWAVQFREAISSANALEDKIERVRKGLRTEALLFLSLGAPKTPQPDLMDSKIADILSSIPEQQCLNDHHIALLSKNSI